MYRVLAIVIVGLTATSPALGEMFNPSLKLLVRECKRGMVVLDLQDKGANDLALPENYIGLAMCRARLEGARRALTGDPGIPSWTCIKPATALGDRMVRAFIEYHSNLERTGAGQKHLQDFERMPVNFTLEALRSVYGCPQKSTPEVVAAEDLDLSVLMPIEELPTESTPTDIEVRELMAVGDLPAAAPEKVVAAPKHDVAETTFDDLPMAKPKRAEVTVDVSIPKRKPVTEVTFDDLPMAKPKRAEVAVDDSIPKRKPATEATVGELTLGKE